MITVKKLSAQSVNRMKWTRRLESSNDETNLDQIFTELTERGVKVERNDGEIVYDGNELNFTITEDEVEYTHLTGVGIENDLQALFYIQTSLKSDHGYTQESIEAEQADPEIEMDYS